MASENNAESSIFLLATKNKFRYTTTRGSVTTEDLWDLSLEDLDKVAVQLDGSANASKSFIKKRTNTDAELINKLNVVKAVIEHKMAADDARKLAVLKRQQAAELKEILARKNAEKLAGLSEEEILKRLEELKES